MDTFIHYGMAAGMQAIKDSGIEVTPENAERIGVNIGSGIGGLPMIEDTHNDYLEGGPRKISPFFIPGTIINMISGNLSIMYGLKGPNLAVVTACTTATALHRRFGAHDRIRRCRRDGLRRRGIDRIAAGGRRFCLGQARCPRATTIPATASRPWDKGRDGFVLGEGAGVLVLEEYEHAKARGAKIYAELAGFGMSGDAYHMTAPRHRRPATLHASTPCAMPASIRTRWSTSMPTALPRRWATRTKPRRSSWPSAMPREKLVVNSTKSMTGHLLGGAGGVESVFTVLAVHHQIVAADHQHLRAGSRVRSGLLRQHGAGDEDRRRAEEQLRFRRHQRLAGVSARLNLFLGAKRAGHCINRHAA